MYRKLSEAYSELSKEAKTDVAESLLKMATADDIIEGLYMQKLAETSASKTIDDLYKKAKMESPTKSETKKESGKVSKKDTDYLADIDCENCDYTGKPTYDGCCPKCGAIGGVKPKDNAPEGENIIGEPQEGISLEEADRIGRYNEW
jgi:hypothetical protein